MTTKSIYWVIVDAQRWGWSMKQTMDCLIERGASYSDLVEHILLYGGRR